MTEAFMNRGFETGSLSPWVGNGVVVSSVQHSGTYSVEMDWDIYVEQTFDLAIAKAWCSAFGFYAMGAGSVEVTLYFSDATSSTASQGVGYPYDEWNYIDVLNWIINPCTGEYLFPANKKVTKIRITSRYGLIHVDDASLLYELISLIITGSVTFESSHVLAAKITDASKVAIRDIPRRANGSIIDYGTWTQSPIGLEFEVRVSTPEKVTLESIFNNSAFVTVELNSEVGTWTFTNAWLTTKKITYEYSKTDDGTERNWKTKIILIAETATYEES